MTKLTVFSHGIHENYGYMRIVLSYILLALPRHAQQSATTLQEPIPVSSPPQPEWRSASNRCPRHLEGSGMGEGWERTDLSLSFTVGVLRAESG